MELNSKNIKKIILIITAAILIFTAFENITFIYDCVKRFIEVFFPVILGLCFAFALNILMRFFEEKILRFNLKGKLKFLNSSKRVISLILSFITVILVVTVLMLVIFPQIGETFNSLALSIPSYGERVLIWFKEILDNNNIPIERISAFEINWNNLFEVLGEMLMNSSNSLINTATDITTSVFSIVFNLIVAVIIAIYVLLQKEKIQRFFIRSMKAFLPENINGWIIKVASISYNSFSNFITGQLIEAVILGSLCFIGMIIFRFPYAGVIPVIIAVSALIPIFGAWIGGGISAFLILMVNPFQALIFIIFILILQQLEGNLIYPKVVGKSVGLPGLLVLIAVIIGGDLGGVCGIIFSVPLCSVGYTVFTDIVESRLSKLN